MSRRLLTVEENGHTPQSRTTNACVEGEITRQKGGGRRHYEGENYVGQYSNCRGRSKHFATDEHGYSTYRNSRYANNSDSTDGETESDSEITVTTSSSKGRQKKRKNRRRIRTNYDTIYKADDECDYKRSNNAVDTKNCMRVSKEHPPAATNPQGPRPIANGPSANYFEQTANQPGIKNTPTNATTINENPRATKAMLRFMDKLFRTLGDVKDGTTTNSITPTREAYEPKVPAIIGNTSVTNQDERNVRDMAPNTPHYEQNYARMQLPQQIVYQTHITHVPTQNTRYPSFNKNCICSQNTEAEKTSGKFMPQGEYRQISQLAPKATQPQALAPTVVTSPTPQLPAQAQEKVQNVQFTPQRYSFPQYPCVPYTQPTPMPLRSGIPQEYMPGASRQPVACTPPPTGAATHASIRTLPPGIYKSHVEEYVLSRTPQGPALQKTVSTVESLEQSNMRAGTPTQFSQQFSVTQQPTQPISAEGRKQNTEFSLLRNTREQTHQTRQPASASNQYVTVNHGINISGTAENINELQYLETQQSSNQYLTSNGQIADATPSRTQKAVNVYSLGNEPLQQTNLPSQKLYLSTDALNNPIVDTYYKGSRQFAGVENSVEEPENHNGINNDGSTEGNGKSSDLIDVENKANENRTTEQEEVKHSQTLEDEANHGNQKREQIKESESRKSEKASRKSRKGEPMRTNREGKSGEVAANKKSKPNRESKYSNKKENTPEMNEEFSTDKEMQRQTSSGSCNSDYLRECLRRKRNKNKNKRKKRHGDSFSDSEDETSNGYSEYSSYTERDMRRKRHGKYEPTDSGSDDDMQYSLSRTSCKELKKCCSRIVAICRMARDTAGTQTEQWEDSASLPLQRSNKLVDGLPKSLADGLAVANPRVVKQIMQLNRDRRKCRVCACGLMNETGAPIVNDDMYILNDDNEPKLPSRMCMARKSRCKCNCGCKLSDTESEIIREIIRKKRLQEKSKRINALRQNKYDSCDCHSACDFVDEEDEREFIANLLRKQRRNRDRERDRTQAQNMYENCVCDCASKAKELATEIMHEMVKSHIQKIVTDELQNKTRSYENRKGVCTCNFAERPTVGPKTEGIKQLAGVCSCEAGKSSTWTPKCRKTGPQTFECTCEPDDQIPTVGSGTERVQPQAGVCTCDYDENPTVRSKVERMKPQPGVCTCDSNENPTVRLKGERTKPQSGVCTCDVDEVAGKSSTRTPKCRKTGPQTFECTCEPDEIPTVRPKTGRVQPQAGVCTCDSGEARTVRHKSGRSKAQMFECACETDDSSASAPKSERVAPRTGVCTCESDEIPITVPKSERTKLRNFECICDPIESRTVTQTFTRTIELQSGGPTNNEMSSPKRYSNDNPEPTKKKRKSIKKQSRNSRGSKSAEDNENEYITLMQNSMATERKGDESPKDAISKSEQGSRRNSLEAQQDSNSDKTTADPQINNSSSSGERLSIRIRKNKTNQKETTKQNEEYAPASYYEDRIEARRKITVKSYQAGPPKLPRDELKRCRDDCACKERATQPKAFRTTKETCRADGSCKQAIEPAFNDIEEYALSNGRNMARTMVPKSNNSYEDNSLKADSGHGSIKMIIADTKASKKAHASSTVKGYPQSNKVAERDTRGSLDREAQGSDSEMLLEQRAALCTELTMNELLPQHSLRTLLTKLSSPDGKLYAADEFTAQPEEILRLAKINQSKMLRMPSTDKRKLGPTTVMAHSLHLTGKQSKSEIEPAVEPSRLVSENRQLKPPSSTPSFSESCGLSSVESALQQQQQHNQPHAANRLHGLNNKFVRKSRIPLPINSSTYRAEKQRKSVAKSSSAEQRANKRPLIEQKSDSNHQITRLWPEQAAIAAQRLRQEKTANDSNELGAKQLKKSQSNIELSCVLNYSPTRPRLESGRQEELPKHSSQESQMSAVSQRKAENTKESFGSSNPENMQLKMLNILSAANQSATSSSGLSSESCKTDSLQTQNEQRCARCRAFYKKTGAHRNIKELQADANGRRKYEPQPRLSPTFIPATIHATPKHCDAERFSITDDEQTDSDIECITVEYGGSEGDSYTQYQDELLKKQQLWRKGTVREALEVEEKAERAKNLQRTTLTGECLERAIHYPTRVWNEERKQLNLQRNGAGIFWPL